MMMTGVISKGFDVLFSYTWIGFCCPVRESGEPSKRKPYLPPEKQYLITRNGMMTSLEVR